MHKGALRWLLRASRSGAADTRALVLANALQAAMAFTTTFALTRFFDADAFAAWGLGQVLFQVLFPVLSLGLVPVLSAVNVTLDGVDSEEEQARARATLTTVLKTVAATGAVATSAALAFDLQRQSLTLLPIVAAASAWALPQLIQGHERATGRMASSAVTLSLQVLFAYGLGILAVRANSTPAAFWLGSAAGSGLVAAWWLKRESARVTAPSLQVTTVPLAPLVRRSVIGLVATAASILSVGLLRPIAQQFSGTDAVVALTLATQYAQIGGLVQHVVWSRLGPDAIRAQSTGDEQRVRQLARRSRQVLGATWIVQVALAAPVLRLLAGDLYGGSTLLIMAAALAAVPLANVRYDARVGIIWRQGSTALLSIMSVTSMAVTVLGAASLAHADRPALIPLALLASRVALGKTIEILSRRWSHT